TLQTAVDTSYTLHCVCVCVCVCVFSCIAIFVRTSLRTLSSLQGCQILSFCLCCWCQSRLARLLPADRKLTVTRITTHYMHSLSNIHYPSSAYVQMI
uniref:Uncharacterized protein n=1 Tax=Neolamprologus brichardi TaxID=32507 RepID=A0A3Q4H8G1_NEOBR